MALVIYVKHRLIWTYTKAKAGWQGPGIYSNSVLGAIVEEYLFGHTWWLWAWDGTCDTWPLTGVDFGYCQITTSLRLCQIPNWHPQHNWLDGDFEHSWMMASTSTTLLWWKIRWHIVDRDWSIVADSLIVNITTCDNVWLQVVSRIIHPGADHSLHIMDKLSVSHSAHISFRKSENSVAFLQNSCELPQHSWWRSRMWSLSGITGIQCELFS